MGEPLGLGELHEIRLDAPGDGLQREPEPAYQSSQLVGGRRVSSVNDVTCLVGSSTSQPGRVLLNECTTRQCSVCTTSSRGGGEPAACWSQE